MGILKYLRQVLLDERGIFGLFGGDDPAPFVLPDKEARAKIDQFQNFGQSAVTGPSQAGQLSLDELDRQKQLSLGQAAQAGQAGQATGLSNLQLFGGAGGGSGERLTRQAGQRQQVGTQQLLSDFSGQRSGLFAGDLANEQQRRDRAKEQALQGELGILGARTSAELGRVGQAAQKRAQRGQLFGTLGTLAGIGLGGGVGGGLAGGAIGKLFGS